MVSTETWKHSQRDCFSYSPHDLLFPQLTCVAVGDVCNKGRVSYEMFNDLQQWIRKILVVECVFFFCSVWQNFVVAVGAEGWFHLFDLTAATASKSDSSSQHEFTSSEDQKPLFTQHIPANTKVILISDIGKPSLCFLTTIRPSCVLILWIWPHGVHVCSVDGDGRCELVVGYTDRVVRAFRWEEPSDGSDVGTGQLVLLKKWLLEGQVDLRPATWNLPHSVYCIILANWKFNTRIFVQNFKKN